jgi:hypothetical protein
MQSVYGLKSHINPCWRRKFGVTVCIVFCCVLHGGVLSVYCWWLLLFYVKNARWRRSEKHKWKFLIFWMWEVWWMMGNLQVLLSCKQVSFVFSQADNTHYKHHTHIYINQLKALLSHFEHDTLKPHLSSLPSLFREPTSCVMNPICSQAYGIRIYSSIIKLWASSQFVFTGDPYLAPSLIGTQYYSWPCDKNYDYGILK